MFKNIFLEKNLLFNIRYLLRKIWQILFLNIKFLFLKKKNKFMKERYLLPNRYKEKNYLVNIGNKRNNL